MRGRPRHLDQRRPDDPVPNPVAAPELGDHRVLRLTRLLMPDRLVQLRVELRADRVDRLQAVGAERLFELAHAELEAFHPRLVDRKSTRLNSSHGSISYA